jgi:rod shape-determining protein MreC
LIIDENSNVDALIQRSRTPAILQGAGSQGAILKYVPKKETVNPGDVVVCSGMTAVFPKGRLLGTVLSVDGSSSSLFLSIMVAPAVDFLRLEEVVIPLQEIP